MLPFLRVWISMLNWKKSRSKMQCQKTALLSKTEGFLLYSKVSAIFNWWITSNRWRDNWCLDDKCEAEKSLCLIQMVVLLENIIIFFYSMHIYWVLTMCNVLNCGGYKQETICAKSWQFVDIRYIYIFMHAHRTVK